MIWLADWLIDLGCCRVEEYFSFIFTQVVLCRARKQSHVVPVNVLDHKVTVGQCLQIMNTNKSQYNYFVFTRFLHKYTFSLLGWNNIDSVHLKVINVSETRTTTEPSIYTVWQGRTDRVARLGDVDRLAVLSEPGDPGCGQALSTAVQLNVATFELNPLWCPHENACSACGTFAAPLRGTRRFGWYVGVILVCAT